MNPKTVTFKCTLALTVLAILACVDYFLIGGKIRAVEPVAEKISISGRQRMLSQRAALLASQITSHSAQTNEQASQKLQSLLTIMEQGHATLLSSGYPHRGRTKLSKELNRIYFDPPLALDQHIQNYLVAGRALLAAPLAEQTAENVHFQSMLRMAEPLLAGLDAAVSQYQHEGQQVLASIRQLERLTLFSVISCLLITGLVIFRQAKSELRGTNEGLRLSEARFQSLSDASPIGIFLNDTMGKCIYTNPRWQQITGMSFDDALGDGWRSMIHPEDADDVLWSGKEVLELVKNFRMSFVLSCQMALTAGSILELLRSSRIKTFPAVTWVPPKTLPNDEKLRRHCAKVRSALRWRFGARKTGSGIGISLRTKTIFRPGLRN